MQELRKFLEILQDTERKVILIGHGLGESLWLNKARLLVKCNVLILCFTLLSPKLIIILKDKLRLK